MDYATVIDDRAVDDDTAGLELENRSLRAEVKQLRAALTRLLGFAETAEVMIEYLYGDARSLTQIKADGCLTPAIAQACEALASGCA